MLLLWVFTIAFLMRNEQIRIRPVVFVVIVQIRPVSAQRWLLPSCFESMVKSIDFVDVTNLVMCILLFMVFLISLSAVHIGQDCL